MRKHALTVSPAGELKSRVSYIEVFADRAHLGLPIRGARYVAYCGVDDPGVAVRPASLGLWRSYRTEILYRNFYERPLDSGTFGATMDTGDITGSLSVTTIVAFRHRICPINRLEN